MKFRVLALAAALFSIVFAGCSAVSVPGAGGGSSSGTGSLKTQQDEIVKIFKSAVVEIFEAQAILLEALDLKEEADKLLADAAMLKQGNTMEGSGKSIVESSNKAGKKFREKVDQAGALNKEKAEMAKKAVEPFLKGNAKMVASLPFAADFLKGLRTP